MKYSLGGVFFGLLFLFAMVGCITNIAVFFGIGLACAPLTIIGMFVSDALYARTVIPLNDLRSEYIIDAKTDEIFSLRGRD